LPSAETLYALSLPVISVLLIGAVLAAALVLTLSRGAREWDDNRAISYLASRGYTVSAGAGSDFDMKGYRIYNLGNAVESQDAVTKAQLDALGATRIALPEGSAPGDILYYDGTSWARLPRGDTGEFLQAGEIPQWAKVTRGASLVIAASNSPPLSRQQADYVCDGVNDEEEIQAAIDSLPGDEPTGGGTIVLLEGDFYFSSPVSFTKRAVIVGQGIRATTIHLADGANSNMFEARGGVRYAGPAHRRGIRHAGLAHLRLDGNKEGQTGVSNGIWLGSTQGFVVYHVLIHNFRDNGILIGDAEAEWTQQVVRIYSSEIGNNDGAGIYIDDAGVGNIIVWIDRVSTWSNGRDVDILDSTGKNHSIFITDNWFDGAQNENIRIRGATLVNITGNIITDAGYMTGFQSRDNISIEGYQGRASQYITIVGNQIGNFTQNTGRYGIAIRGDSDYIEVGHNVYLEAGGALVGKVYLEPGANPHGSVEGG
jgi:hypothetical protein